MAAARAKTPVNVALMLFIHWDLPDAYVFYFQLLICSTKHHFPNWF